MFTARRYDAETSLYYYRARMYSPALGRFMQTDPIGYDDGLNMYTYCGNNSINFVDPSGLCKDDPWYKQSWEAIGGFGIGFLEFVYDTEVALLNPIDTASSIWDSMYGMGERFNQAMYDIGANPGMVSDMARDLRELGGQILFEEIDNATSDPFEYGRSIGRITAGAEMAVVASAIAGEITIDLPRGTRILQIRSTSTGKPFFRVDRGPVPGRGTRLHYHRRPDLSRHRPYEGL